MGEHTHRLRVVFTKTGPLQYTSHLDLVRVWERTLRRAGLPVAYTQGFNPRVRMQLAAALPLGHVGEAELMDIWLTEIISPAHFQARIAPVSPEGLHVQEVFPVPLDAKALPPQVVSAEYRVWVPSDTVPSHTLAQAVARLLAAPEWPAERRGRSYDLRPLIERLTLGEKADEWQALNMCLAARPGATARPEAVVEALGLNSMHARYNRRRLILQES